MGTSGRRWWRCLVRHFDAQGLHWRTGSTEGQLFVLGVLTVLTLGTFIGGFVASHVFGASTFLIPLLLGGIALRFRPLAALVVVVVIVATITSARLIAEGGSSVERISSMVVLGLTGIIVLFNASRIRSGLPGPLGESMLMDLRDRLYAQGIVPPLPEDWFVESAMDSAGGAMFAGDFMVAHLSDDQRHLEIVLVDVCGKGVGAGTQSLQFAGALGGLIGSLPPLGLLAAANDYLLRQRWDDGFATAVHANVDLVTGNYSILNAGHPPALLWSVEKHQWLVDEASGLALGIERFPRFGRSSGFLQPGDALMFYTDGVVETRSRDVDTGIAWLRSTAASAISESFDGATRRIVLASEQGADDDKAVLILSRNSISREPMI